MFKMPVADKLQKYSSKLTHTPRKPYKSGGWGKGCVADGCKNYSGLQPGLQFVTLPKDLERLKTWLLHLGRNDLMERSVRNMRVCSEHFTDWDFVRHGDRKSRLKAMAIPVPVATAINSDSAFQVDHSYASEPPPHMSISDHPYSSKQKNRLKQNSTDSTNSSSPTRWSPTSSPSISPIAPHTRLSDAEPYTTTHIEIHTAEQSHLESETKHKKILTMQPSLAPPTTPSRKTPSNSHGSRQIIIKKLRNRNQYLTSKIKKLTRAPSKCEIVNELKKMLPQSTFNFIKYQIYFSGIKNQGHRWPQEIKSFCAQMRDISPEAYEFLGSIFKLPSVRTIN